MPIGDRKFTITCTMRERWVPVFLGMLKQMQYLGGIGSSRVNDASGNTYFDAG